MTFLKIGALAALIGLCGFFAYVTWFSPHGSAELTWAPPGGNESDEAIADLAGYIIHCWSETGKQTSTIYVDDPAITKYEVNKLWPGEYFCAVTAVGADGAESALSNVVATTVR